VLNTFPASIPATVTPVKILRTAVCIIAVANILIILTQFYFRASIDRFIGA
jgi:hypothetical protein